MNITDIEPIDILGKEMGVINKTKNAYITRRKRTEHYFRKYKGYGISTAILDKLKERNIENIILIEITKKGEKVLRTTRQEFYKNGIRHKNKEADNQIILPEERWR